jgi:hypothetical protein
LKPFKSPYKATSKRRLAMGIIFLSFTLFACQTTTNSPSKNSLIGSYETSTGTFYNKLKWLFIEGKYSYDASSKLRLEDNNTFSLKGCKCEAKGQWLLKNDTVIIVNKQMDTGKFQGSCKEEFAFKYVVLENGSLLQVFPDYEMITLMRKVNNTAQSSNKQSRQ